MPETEGVEKIPFEIGKRHPVHPLPRDHDDIERGPQLRATARKRARKRRLTRLRTTAGPTRRETARPRRDGAHPRSPTCRWKCRPGIHRPSFRSRSNSPLFRMRCSREKRIRRLFGGGQASPTLPSPCGEDLATGLGRIALAEAELAGSLDLGRTIGRLHDSSEKREMKNPFGDRCQPLDGPI